MSANQMTGAQLGAQPAFPATGDDYVDHVAHGRVSRASLGEGYANSPGMTLRQHYAGLAMQAMASSFYTEGSGDYWRDDLARAAVNIADALLAKLAKVRP